MISEREAPQPGADKPRVDAAPVLEWAGALRRRLLPACEKAVIAGSLRRRRPTCGDVELVLLPRYDADLFGGADATYSDLDRILAECLRDGTLVRDTAVKRDGARYKRFVAPALGPHVGGPPGGLPCELFIAAPENFGNTLAIRTGSAEFSQLLVTERRYGGLMPAGMRQHKGALRRGEELIACRTEAEFFAALGLPTPAPEERDAALVPRLWGAAADG